MYPSPRGGLPIPRDADQIETERPPPVRPSGIRPRPTFPAGPPTDAEPQRDTLPTIPETESSDWDLPLENARTIPAPPNTDTLIDDLLDAPPVTEVRPRR